MKTLFAIALIGFTVLMLQCSSKETQSTEAREDTTRYEAEIQEPEKIDLRGDFNGDGQPETAVLRLIKTGESQDNPWIYTIVFSDPAIHSFTFTAELESPRILNEGLLNNIPGDEMSIITQASMTDDSYINVYSLSNGLWGAAMENVDAPISLPDSLRFEDIVFADSGKVFNYRFENKIIPGSSNPDGNNFEISYYKTKAKLYASIEPMSNRFLEEEIMGSMDADGDGTEELMRIVRLLPRKKTLTCVWSLAIPKSNRWHWATHALLKCTLKVISMACAAANCLY